MARRYDLGSVVGEIHFDYDKNGVQRARDDMGRFIKTTDEGGDHFDLFSKRGVAAAGKIVKSFALIAAAMAATAGSLNLLNGIVVALVQMSQAGALLPGLFAGFAASIATVALGVDGIKKAFEGLKPTLDTLKSQVSDAFEKSLTPAVNNLKTVLPQLTTGFRNIATAMGDSATKFTEMLKQGTSVNALNNILNQTAGITRNVGAAAAPLGQAFLSIASIGISFITPMTKGLAGLATQFNNWVQSAQGQAQINDMINTGIQAFKIFFGIISQLGGIVVAVFQGLSTSTGNFGSSLVDTLKAVKEFLRSAEGFNALQAIGQTLQDVGAVVRTVLLTALKELAPAIPPLLQAFSDLAQQVMPILIKALEIVGPIVVKLAQAIADNINWIGPLIIALGAWAAAQWVLNAALDANPIGLVILALAALAAAVALVITNWDSIASFFKGIWDSVWQWTSDRITNIRDFIVNTWNDIVSWFSSLGNRIATAFQSVLDWFAALPVLIGNFLLSLPTTLWNLFTAAVQGILSALKQGLEWIIAWAIALPILTIKALASFGQMLIDWIVSAWNGLITNANTLADQFIAWATALPGRIIDGLIAWGGMLVQWFTDAWNWLQTTGAQRAAEFIVWIQGLPDRIIAAIQRFVEDARNWATQAFQALWDAAVQKAAQFLNWVRGLPGQIINILSTLGSKMVSIGGDIVRGIWQGIQNLAGWLWNQVTGFVGGIVDKVQSLLDIGSPSKVFADQVGRWIPAGIAQGIDQHANLVADSLQQMFNNVQPNVDNIVTPLGRAAQQILDQISKNGSIFEDFSFRGNSDLVSQFNDQISGMFFDGTNKDFGQVSDGELSSFLSNLIAAQTTSNPQAVSTNTSSNSSVVIQNLNVAGNLDPTNATQWRQALVNIKDGIRDVERQYA